MKYVLGSVVLVGLCIGFAFQSIVTPRNERAIERSKAVSDPVQVAPTEPATVQLSEESRESLYQAARVVLDETLANKAKLEVYYDSSYHVMQLRVALDERESECKLVMAALLQSNDGDAVSRIQRIEGMSERLKTLAAEVNREKDDR